MPRSPRTPCTADPRCPALVDTPGPCPAHRTERRAQRRERETWANYGTQWPRIRARVLMHEPMCRVCGAIATDVDHITPLRDGGTNARDNLQPLCHSCHSRKTARDNNFGGARE